jgi:hypothetical protein
VLHALEQISDFTVGETPDVVFLHVDRIEAELAMLENMLLCADDFHASVLAYPDHEKQNPMSLDDVGALASQLERLIPEGHHVN